jgi:hypothetical protein
MQSKDSKEWGRASVRCGRERDTRARSVITFPKRQVETNEAVAVAVAVAAGATLDSFSLIIHSHPSSISPV